MNYPLIDAIENNDIKGIRVYVNHYYNEYLMMHLELALKNDRIIIMKIFLESGLIPEESIHELLISAINGKYFNMAELIFRYSTLDDDDYHNLSKYYDDTDDCDDIDILKFYLEHTRLSGSYILDVILDRAIECYDFNIIQLVLEHGATPFDMEKKDNPMFKAINDNDIELVGVF